MQQEDVAYRLEEYALKLIDFIHSLNDFPFIIETPPYDSKYQSFNLEKKKQTNKILQILSNLEQIVECLLVFAFAEQSDMDENVMLNKNIA
mmetsp:Transcript_30158/g.29465  ORF Transcript_30158/g.29465 Transcript_30158/m.29465 type:complete len:91 (+) Transcript_30158:892-1164(+)